MKSDDETSSEEEEIGIIFDPKPFSSRKRKRKTSTSSDTSSKFASISDIENQEPKSPIKSRYGRISRKPVNNPIIEEKRIPRKLRKPVIKKEVSKTDAGENHAPADIVYKKERQKVIKERIIVDPIDSDEPIEKPKKSHSQKAKIDQNSVKAVGDFFLIRNRIILFIFVFYFFTQISALSDPAVLSTK